MVDYIIGLVIGCYVVYVVKSLFFGKKRSACHGNCGHCSGCK